MTSGAGFGDDAFMAIVQTGQVGLRDVSVAHGAALIHIDVVIGL